MIFLTLGMQLAFDRLVQAVDEVAVDLGEDIVGQIGHGSYKPKNFQSVATLPPDIFVQRFREARIVIGHAGIGTILSGIRAEKPLVLMARMAKFGEHRNDHQLATVQQLRKLSGVHIAESSADIRRFLSDPSLEAMKNEASRNRIELVERIRSEIFTLRSPAK